MRKRRIASALALLITVLLACASAAHASDLHTVTKLDDTADGVCGSDCSLREALLAANADADADEIVFQPGLTGTISLTHANNELNITEPVKISGPGAQLLSINGTIGSDDQQIFFIDLASSALVAIEDLTLTDGEADNSGAEDNGNGGAIRNVDASLKVIRCILSGNAATLAGGAVSTEPTGSMNIDDSTLTGNSAGEYGGAVENRGYSSIEGSTISGNHADPSLGFGGGIYQSGNDILYVVESTVAANTAAGGGGIGNSSTSDVDINGSIVAGNLALVHIYGPDPLPTDLGGEFGASSSLIQSPGESAITTSVPNSNVIGQDPELGPLEDNGGPTPTRLPAPDSPAVDAGHAFSLPGSTDQRGMLRLVDVLAIPNSSAPMADGTDMGAVELTLAEATPPIPPAPPAGSAPALVPPVAAPTPVAAKKCGKGRKLKRGRCVKKRK